MLGRIEKDFASRASTAFTITLYCHSLKEEQRLLLELAAFLGGKLVIEEDALPQDESLTYTERIVYTLLFDGLSCRQISEKLSIDFETVRWHKKNIFRKLHVSTINAFLKKPLQGNTDGNVAF